MWQSCRYTRVIAGMLRDSNGVPVLPSLQRQLPPVEGHRADGWLQLLAIPGNTARCWLGISLPVGSIR